MSYNDVLRVPREVSNCTELQPLPLVSAIAIRCYIQYLLWTGCGATTKDEDGGCSSVENVDR